MRRSRSRRAKSCAHFGLMPGRMGRKPERQGSRAIWASGVGAQGRPAVGGPLHAYANDGEPDAANTDHNVQEIDHDLEQAQTTHSASPAGRWFGAVVAPSPAPRLGDPTPAARR